MTTTIRAAATAAGTLLTLSCLAGCGSNAAEEGSATPTDPGVQLPTVSARVFADQGNAACRRTAEAIGAPFRDMGTPPTRTELAGAYDVMLRESYRLVGELLAVGPPAGQERELLDLLVQQHEVTATAEEQGATAFFADEDSDPWADVVDTLVDDFGLTDCGRGE